MSNQAVYLKHMIRLISVKVD